MSQEDIDKAVKDAEKFAEEDKRAKEAVETKNRAESMIFQSEKTLNELGDKIDAGDKADIQSAIDRLRNTVNGGDTEAIKADTEALEKAFYKVSEKLYQQQAAQGQPGDDAGQANGGDSGTYYDASYEDTTNNN
jgi:molecular chaperone DnaK